MLIACDLDRTLLPNGHEPDDGLLSKFLEVMKTSEHVLVYVTGRSVSMVLDAREEFGLELPDYLIGDVGTTIYRKDKNGEMSSEKGWVEYVCKKSPQWNVHALRDKIPESEVLFLQEEFVQNQFKVSYYVRNPAMLDIQVSIVKEYVYAVSGRDAQVIGSIDPHKNLGLIDVLPNSATKEAALQYLVHILHLTSDDVIYAGDSGNDILPLTSGYKAILVRNAPDAVKKKVQQLVQEKNLEEKMYLAHGTAVGNGNYASGVLEGLVHFGVIPHELLTGGV